MGYYVSYAKDIFCALEEAKYQGTPENRMKIATDLVKQAMQELQ